MSLLHEMGKRHEYLISNDRCFVEFPEWLRNQLVTRFVVILDKINILLVNHNRNELKLIEAKALIYRCVGTPVLTPFVGRYTPNREPNRAMADLLQAVELLRQEYAHHLKPKQVQPAFDEIVDAQSEVALLPKTAVINRFLTRQLMIPGIAPPKEKPRLGKREKECLGVVKAKPITPGDLLAKLTMRNAKYWTSRKLYKVIDALSAKEVIVKQAGEYEYTLVAA